MRVETTTNNRKAMAHALAERLGIECRYMGTPTYAYRVGNLTIERDGAIIGEHLELLAVTGWLLEHGYITEPIPMVEQPATENIEEQPAEKTTPDLEAAADESITHTCVFLPLSSFTPTGLKNLIRMLYARQRLICEMTRSRDIVIEPEVITTLQSDALTELPILERVLRESIEHGFIKGIDLEDGRIGLVFPHDEIDTHPAYGDSRRVGRVEGKVSRDSLISTCASRCTRERSSSVGSEPRLWVPNTTSTHGARRAISPRSFCARQPPTAICMPGLRSLAGRRCPRLP